MEKDVLIAFIIFQAVFFLLDAYVFAKTNRDIARRGEYTFFSALIIVHMVYLVFNSLWTLQEYGILHLPHAEMTLLCIGSFLSVTGCSFLFFRFTIEKIRFALFRKTLVRILYLIPGILTTALILATPWTDWIFRLDYDNTIIHGPAYPVMLVSSSVYLLAVAVMAGYNLVRAKTTLRRRSSVALLLSVLIIISFVELDDLIPKASILPVAVFAVILMIFINMQDSNINSDALTGMNNRRKAVEYVTSRLSGVSEETPLFLYMCDLNDFKGINDSYGHAEGDEALLLCGSVLTHTVARYNGFAARFGGDEFLICLHPAKEDEMDPDRLTEEINQRLGEQMEEMRKPYRLTISVGYARCADRGEALPACIRRADEMLYHHKKVYHSQQSS